MIEYIQGYLVIPLEILCCKIFYEIFCQDKRRIRWFCQIIIWGLLCSLIYCCAIFMDAFFILKEICIINIIALMAKFYWDITYRKSYILAVIFQSVVLLADYITVIMDKNLLTEIDMQNAMGQPLVILLSKIFLFLLVVFIKTIFRGDLEYLSDRGWLKFLFFPLFSICTITILISNIDMVKNTRQGWLFWLFAFGMAGMNIFLFYFIQDTAKKERLLQENRLFEIEANNRLRFYETVSASYEEQKMLSHEYQNQLLCIRLLLQEKEYQELDEYMNLNYISTNHVIVDAILNEKYRKALEEDIVMVWKLGDLSGVAMEKQDIALLLSNLLNNAIEACRKCKENRMIKCKMVLEKGDLIVSVRNTYDGNICFADGEYLTTKRKEIGNHGLGIKNVIQVVHKYQGIYSIRHTDTEFYFSIVIPQEAVNK